MGVALQEWFKHLIGVATAIVEVGDDGNAIDTFEFGKDGGGSLNIDRSSGQTTSEDVIDMLGDQDGSAFSATEIIASSESGVLTGR